MRRNHHLDLILWIIMLLGGAVFFFNASGCLIPETRVSPAEADGEELPILWEKSGACSRLRRNVRLVVHDQATLAQIPLTEVPVDFNTQMVLIAGLGPTPRDDVGIRITRVWREGNRLRVQERQVHSGANDNVGFQPASPWTVVVVPKSALNVEGYSAQAPKAILGEHPGAR